MSDPQRLQKILARWGVASRRQAEVMIRNGRVTVNGSVIRQLGTKADPDSDRILVDGKPLQASQTSADPTAPDRLISPPKLKYLLLNKPPGVISTCFDPKGRKTVLDLLPARWRSQTRFFPVGRLDASSTGALLLTNDGELTLKLTHPRYHLPKTYRVEVSGVPPESVLKRWRKGVELEDGATLPAKVFKKRVLASRQHTILKIILQEGRNRQIRRVAERLGYPVVALHREAIGPLKLADLPVGHYRPLLPEELLSLQSERGELPQLHPRQSFNQKR